MLAILLALWWNEQGLNTLCFSNCLLVHWFSTHKWVLRATVLELDMWTFPWTVVQVHRSLTKKSLEVLFVLLNWINLKSSRFHRVITCLRGVFWFWICSWRVENDTAGIYFGFLAPYSLWKCMIRCELCDEVSMMSMLNHCWGLLGSLLHVME